SPHPTSLRRAKPASARLGIGCQQGLRSAGQVDEERRRPAARLDDVDGAAVSLDGPLAEVEAEPGVAAGGALAAAAAELLEDAVALGDGDGRPVVRDRDLDAVVRPRLDG